MFSLVHFLPLSSGVYSASWVISVGVCVRCSSLREHDYRHEKHPNIQFKRKAVKLVRCCHWHRDGDCAPHSSADTLTAHQCCSWHLPLYTASQWTSAFLRASVPEVIFSVSGNPHRLSVEEWARPSSKRRCIMTINIWSGHKWKKHCCISGLCA